MLKIIKRQQQRRKNRALKHTWFFPCRPSSFLMLCLYELLNGHIPTVWHVPFVIIVRMN